jgi:hypothetical protein
LGNSEISEESSSKDSIMDLFSSQFSGLDGFRRAKTETIIIDAENSKEINTRVMSRKISRFLIFSSLFEFLFLLNLISAM